MCLISEKVEANPLNGMKNCQKKSEAQIEYRGYWIGNDLLHRTKVQNLKKIENRVKVNNFYGFTSCIKLRI